MDPIVVAVFLLGLISVPGSYRLLAWRHGYSELRKHFAPQRVDVEETPPEPSQLWLGSLYIPADIRLTPEFLEVSPSRSWIYRFGGLGRVIIPWSVVTLVRRAEFWWVHYVEVVVMDQGSHSQRLRAGCVIGISSQHWPAVWEHWKAQQRRERKPLNNG